MNIYKILHAKNFRNIMNPPETYLHSLNKTKNTKGFAF